MPLPFTPEQFFAVFTRYNDAVWPLQVLFIVMALAAIALLWTRQPAGQRVIFAILALFWTWMALGYHVAFFTAINPAAWGFAVLFLVQAGLLAWYGVISPRIRLRPALNANTVLGGVLLLFALVVYPWLSVRLGHPYPAMPTFGLPCPTTIFTLGLLLMATPPLPKAVFVIPLLWAAIASVAAFQLDVLQDLGLLAAGLLALVALLFSGAATLRGRFT